MYLPRSAMQNFISRFVGSRLPYLAGVWNSEAVCGCACLNSCRRWKTLCASLGASANPTVLSGEPRSRENRAAQSSSPTECQWRDEGGGREMSGQVCPLTFTLHSTKSSVWEVIYEWNFPPGLQSDTHIYTHRARWNKIATGTEAGRPLRGVWCD